MNTSNQDTIKPAANWAGSKRFALLCTLLPVPVAVFCTMLAFSNSKGDLLAFLAVAVALPPLLAIGLAITSAVRHERAWGWLALGVPLSFAPLGFAVYVLTHLRFGF